jgi:hypothetical protein
LAGHGDDEYYHATPEWIKEYEENRGKSLDSAEKCDKVEVEKKSGELLHIDFSEPMMFNTGDVIRINYRRESDDTVTLSIEIERASEPQTTADQPEQPDRPAEPGA